MYKTMNISGDVAAYYDNNYGGNKGKNLGFGGFVALRSLF